MNSQRTPLRVGSLIFAIVAIGHALRLFRQSQVIIGSHFIPMWVSWVALIGAAVVCIWMWRSASAAR